MDLLQDSVVVINPKAEARLRHRVLLIGVSQYQPNSGFIDIPSVREDLARLRNLLLKHGVTAADVITVGPDPSVTTHRTIEIAIQEFFSSLTEADFALVYLSAHGVQINGQVYLVPTDYCAGSRGTPSLLVSADLSASLLNSRAQVLLQLNDVCRDGADLGVIPWHHAINQQRVLQNENTAAIRIDKASAVVYSCGPAESSLAINTLGGIFTIAIASLLDADPELSLGKFIEHIPGEVEAKRKEYGLPPQFVCSSVIRGVVDPHRLRILPVERTGRSASATVSRLVARRSSLWLRRLRVYSVTKRRVSNWLVFVFSTLLLVVFSICCLVWFVPDEVLPRAFNQFPYYYKGGGSPFAVPTARRLTSSAEEVGGAIRVQPDIGKCYADDLGIIIPVLDNDTVVPGKATALRVTTSYYGASVVVEDFEGQRVKYSPPVSLHIPDGRVLVDRFYYQVAQQDLAPSFGCPVDVWIVSSDSRSDCWLGHAAEEAVANIDWVLWKDSGAGERYHLERVRGQSRFESVLQAQSHNERAQTTIRALGSECTEAYILRMYPEVQ